MAFGHRFSFIFKVFLFLAISLTGGSVYSLYTQVYEQNDKTEASLILIEKGDSLNKIAHRLKKEGFIKSVSVFKLAGRLSGEATNLKAGEYNIPAKASPKLILDILVSGQTVVRRLTVPEGLTSQQVVDLLMGTAALFGEIKDIPANGTLLPETYVFSYGSPRKVVFDRMRESMTQTIAELWPQRSPDLPYTTIQEALVLASIVEKETSVPEERPRIAGVFVNRLRKGMRLQTDPTVIYAVTNGTMELKRALTLSDLEKDHPFNTYRRKGLPPAPICNPGRDSIAAVLNPLETKELYFVANGTGGHSFARTFEEHRANIAAWKKAKRLKRLAAKNAKRRKTAKKTESAKVSRKVETPPVEEIAAAASLEKELHTSELQELALEEEKLIELEGSLAERAPDEGETMPQTDSSVGKKEVVLEKQKESPKTTEPAPAKAAVKKKASKIKEKSASVKK